MRADANPHTAHGGAATMPVAMDEIMTPRGTGSANLR
jgi:hypothetical protein